MSLSKFNSAFIACFLLFGLTASAQQRKIFSGAVVDSAESRAIRMASITNITLGKTTVSRGNGTFELEAGTGNIIAFGANGYYADTLTISLEMYAAGSLLLTLRPLPATLTNVTVLGNMSQYQVDSIERRKNFLQDVGESTIPAVGRANDMGFGVGINLDRWSKKEKRERKARSIFDMMEEDAYVNDRWNESFVGKYTTYKDDELIAFMERNRPQYQWLRKNTSEEALIYFINSALKRERR